MIDKNKYNSGDLYPSLDLLLDLKKIGFNEPCLKKISTKTGFIENCDYDNIKYTNSAIEKEYPECISCPNIYEIAHWFRTKYYIHIDVDYDNSQLWGYTLRYCNDRDDYIDGDSLFMNYEAALINGEKRVIKYIKQVNLDN